MGKLQHDDKWCVYSKTFCKEKNLILNPSSRFRGPRSDLWPGTAPQASLCNMRQTPTLLSNTPGKSCTEESRERATCVLTAGEHKQTASQGLGSQPSSTPGTSDEEKQAQTAPQGALKCTEVWTTMRLEPHEIPRVPLVHFVYSKRTRRYSLSFLFHGLPKSSSIERKNQALGFYIAIIRTSRGGSEISSCQSVIEAHSKPHVQIPGTFKEKQKNI